MNTLRLQLHLRPTTNPTNQTKNNTPHYTQITKSTNVVNPTHTTKKHRIITTNKPHVQEQLKYLNSKILSSKSSYNEHSRIVVLGAASLGVALFLMGFDDHKAWALGPEGPLMEEFWDNMRRYALYALTVSTGALWVLLEPIFQLLKNPISAVLIIVILGGGFFIVSQVVTAMVGLSDFSYEYTS